jgi:hypothetical protein
MDGLTVCALLRVILGCVYGGAIFFAGTKITSMEKKKKKRLLGNDKENCRQV